MIFLISLPVICQNKVGFTAETEGKNTGGKKATVLGDSPLIIT